MKQDIEIPKFSTLTNGTGSVKGLKNPKTLITSEIMMYFYASVFLGFFISSMLSLFGLSLFANSGFGFCATIISFIALAKVNNRFFNTDSKRIKDLVIANHFETLTAILLLERDVIKFLQHPDNVNNIDTLFIKIFPQDHADKKGILLKCSDILRFMESIAPIDRERIYRYYLVESLHQS
jgi:hypothetical protein